MLKSISRHLKASAVEDFAMLSLLEQSDKGFQ